MSAPKSLIDLTPNSTLLIFDLDGTLIDSVPDLADSVNAMLSSLGRNKVDESIIRQWVGNGARVLVSRALSGDIHSDPHLTDAQIDEALASFTTYYQAYTCVRTKPYAGVSQGLFALRQAGYTLAIVTNKPYHFVPVVLETLGWQGLFSLVLGADSLPTKKPDPRPLLHVCETLGFLPLHAYMIGDSKNDIMAGKNAGIKTLGLSYGYNYGEDIRLYVPDVAFDSFDELVAFLLVSNVNKLD